MTNVKDKLSASVRQARAAQQSAPEAVPALDATPVSESAAQSATKPAARKTAAPRKPTARKPAVPRKPTAKPAAVSSPNANTVQESASALFPSRIWPD